MDRKDTNNTVLAEKVFKWWDYPVFILLSVLGLSAITYFLSYWFSLRDWQNYPVSFSIMTVMLLVIIVNNQARWFLLLLMRKPIPMKARPDWKVAVVTTFVPNKEPLEMLEETVRALLALDYPHDTWVLDEGDEDQVKALCLRLGAIHFSRKHLPQYHTENGTFQSHSKHGNYNAWLYQIGFDRYDIITAFDPDHVPDPAFLSDVLGYFEDPTVGYVQVAQAYYNQKASFIARGAAEETYPFYSSTQMASFGMGYPIINRAPDYYAMPQLTGCHNTHRVIALKEVGGFAPHSADDLLLTLFYWDSRWRGVYVPQILARGLTPVDWSGYITQQRRWARSILDIKFRFHPKLSGTLSSKTHVISFLHGLNYLHKSIIIFTSVVLMASMLATGIAPSIASYRILPKLIILCVALQLCELYRQRFYLDSRSEWGFHWRAGLLQLAKWPYHLLALYDVMLSRRFPYTLTRKVSLRSRNYMLLWPHMLVVTLISSAWIIGMVSGCIINPFVRTCAATIVIGSLALIATERMNFPDPYDQSYSQPSR